MGNVFKGTFHRPLNKRFLLSNNGSFIHELDCVSLFIDVCISIITVNACCGGHL